MTWPIQCSADVQGGKGVLFYRKLLLSETTNVATNTIVTKLGVRAFLLPFRRTTRYTITVRDP